MVAKVKEVTTIEPSGQSSPQEGAVILGIIDRMAAMPNFDPERVHQMFELHQKMEATKARKDYYAALADMQPELPVIEKRGTIKTNVKDKQGNKTGEQKEQSKYALWEDIVEAITPVLAKHGFSFQFKIDQPTPGRVLVTGTLGHRGGHSESTGLALPIDTSGSKNNVQGWGSSIQYAKRYVSGALLNYVGRDMASDDNDGQGGEDATLTTDQMTTIRKLLEDTKTGEAAFLVHITKTDTLEEVPQGAFASLTGFLTAKKKKQETEKGAAV